jgi:hypothetical protein
MTATVSLPPDASARLAMLAEMQRRADSSDGEGARGTTHREHAAGERPSNSSG